MQTLTGMDTNAMLSFTHHATAILWNNTVQHKILVGENFGGFNNVK